MSRPIDFEKQPHCLHCGFCIGWGQNYQSCMANVAYKEDGSCAADADFVTQLKLDSYEYPSDYEDDYEDEYEDDYEPEEDEEYVD